MTTKFLADNGTEFEVDGEGFVTGKVMIGVNDLIERDLEGALDLFAEKLVGNTLLSDVSYHAVGTQDGQIEMQISGSVEHILALRAENEEGSSPAP